MAILEVEGRKLRPKTHGSLKQKKKIIRRISRGETTTPKPSRLKEGNVGTEIPKKDLQVRLCFRGRMGLTEFRMKGR